MKCCKSIHLLIGYESKVSKIPAFFLNGIFFIVDLTSSYGSVIYLEELLISIFMCLDVFTIQKFLTEACNPLVKRKLFVSASFDAVVIMDVDPALISDLITSNIATVTLYRVVTDLCRKQMIEEVKKYNPKKSVKYHYYEHDVRVVRWIARIKNGG